MFSDPTYNIEQFGISSDDVVADFGAGSGFYSLAVAKKATSGKVYAVDIQDDLLRKLSTEARARKCTNVETIRADLGMPGSTRLREGSVSKVIVASILIQMDAVAREQALKEAFRILRKGGSMLVIEWFPGSGVGPKPEMCIHPEVLKKLLVQIGFQVARDIDAGAYHYGFVCNK